MTSRTFRQTFFRYSGDTPVAPLSVEIAYLLYRREKLSIAKIVAAIQEARPLAYINPFSIVHYLLVAHDLMHTGANRTYYDFVYNKLRRHYRSGRMETYPEFCKEHAIQFVQTHEAL